MILYQLRCDEEHSFEAWFRDSQAFDEQARTGYVECPYCGSTLVAKAPNAAQAVGSAKEESLCESDIDAASDTRAHEVAQQILDAVGKIRDFTDETSDPEDDANDVARTSGAPRRND